MGLRKILTDQEPALHKTCRPVTDFDKKLHKLLDDMAETLADANGVGLAAPQVGILRRVVIVDTGDEILELAKAADAASEKYNVDIIFTCPVVDIRRVAEATSHIHVFAPHMDPIYPGRGLADTLPEYKLGGVKHSFLERFEEGGGIFD